MKIIWIIDNKFRELYGLYDLKEIKKTQHRTLFVSYSCLENCN